MTEPTWARTEVPPLRTDVDRKRRELRRSLDSEMRGFYLIGSGLLGLAAGALAALITTGGLS